MPSDSSGHHPDKAPPKVTIDENLLTQIRALIPKSWYDWAEHCLALRAQYGVPTEIPAKIGTIDTFSGPVEVHLADFNDIMLRHDMDASQGANGYEDPDVCPKDWVLLDSNVVFPDLLGLVGDGYHETCEGPGDADGKCMATGLNYDQAHERANAKEKMIRLRLGLVQLRPMTGRSPRGE